MILQPNAQTGGHTTTSRGATTPTTSGAENVAAAYKVAPDVRLAYSPHLWLHASEADLPCHLPICIVLYAARLLFIFRLGSCLVLCCRLAGGKVHTSCTVRYVFARYLYCLSRVGFLRPACQAFSYTVAVYLPSRVLAQNLHAAHTVLCTLSVARITCTTAMGSGPTQAWAQAND